ncbi:MAG: hypothetical protein PUG60_11610 [Lachnospiraceae bacterium]|nr:hypothetical protein [Lachnospiraceae bacterium]MDY4969724.1 hypothetical protein [Lachnospiraceae bacterium]
MKRYRKIILAGADNTCESIMAEAIFKNIAGDRPLEIISRGLVVLFPEPVNPKAAAVLQENHLQAFKNYSEKLTIDDITEDTLILALREAQAQKILNTLDPACDVATLRGFVGYKGDTETPSGDMSNYQDAFENLDLLVKAAAQLIFEPIDEELANEPKPLSMAEVERVVQQVFEESVQETLGEDADAVSQKLKEKHEKELEEEYRRVVEKTAAREAAREAAKESEVSEYRLLYEEIKAKNSDKKS